MSVILVGYRGSGKSTVGRVLAQQLGWELVDTDELIVERAGKTIKQIFQEDGEPHFRDLESAALELAMAGEKRVISTGGGMVMREANRQKLKASGLPVVYLSGSAERLLSRIQGDVASAANRPNLTSLGGGRGGLEEVQHMLELRDPLYREVATAVVDTDVLRPVAIAQEIAALLSARK